MILDLSRLSRPAKGRAERVEQGKVIQGVRGGLFEGGSTDRPAKGSVHANHWKF